MFWLSVLYYANPHLFHYLLWEYPFLFMCTFSGTQLGCKTRAWFTYVYTCAQILGTRCPKWMSSFWSPEFLGGSQILGKFVYPFICIYLYTQTMVVLPIGQ